jgi:hypothetical protein
MIMPIRFASSRRPTTECLAGHLHVVARLCFALLLTLMFAGCAERKPQTIPPTPPTPPPAAKVPAHRTPPRPAPKVPEPAEPLLLSPTIADEHKDKMESEVTTKIRRTEQLVAKVDLKQLTEQQSETLSTIQSFLSKAKDALHQKDMPRALNLAEKAQTLAQELPNSANK